MDLMTLAAKITLDDSSFKNGIESAESAGQRLSGRLNAMTIAVGNIMTDLVRKGFDTIKSLTTGAVDAFADYEQLVGGIETLFKGSSDKMMKFAKESYRTTGLSANQYMETVTSFSASLLQGLGGDTEQAAEIANMAVQDMADNANKLGTDMSSIQTAYQGFAKQNYTMLDNLKLGYGGTKEEMVRLINDSGILNTKIKDLDGITFDQMIEAIHKIQEEMGITGTTAAEAAETISGSKASLVAAWNDLMMTVAGADMMDLDTAIAAFQTSFSAYMSNFLPSLMTTLANSGTLVEGIAGALSNLPDNLLSMILSAALEGGTGVVSGIDTAVNWIIDQITMFLHDSAIDTTRVAAFAGAFGLFIGNTVKNVVTKLPTLVNDLFTVGVTMASEILKGIWDGLFGNDAEISLEKIEEEFTNTLTETELQSAKAKGILSTMQSLYDKYGAAARETKEWKDREDELEKVLGGSKETFDQYGDNIQGAINHLQDMSEELRKLAIEQALQDKLTAQYKELAGHEEAKLMAEQAIIDAQDYNKALREQIETTAKAYASEILRNGAAEEGSEAWWTAKQTLEEEGYAGTGMDRLIDALELFYERNDVEGEGTVWGKDETDYILSPEVIQSLEGTFAENDRIIEENTNTIKNEQDAIDKVTAEIGTTQRVIERTAATVGSLGDAADIAAGKLSGIKIPQFEKPAFNTRYGEWTTVTEAPKAVGMDYVPYDGFRAVLHKGEAILTRQDNERRGGYDAGIMESALEAAIERSMSRMNISMNGEKVADLTTDRVNRNISGSDHSRKRAMGG